MCHEDLDKVIPKFQEGMKEREKGSDKFPLLFLENHGMGEFKGFKIYEDATAEQLWNVLLHYRPLLNFKFVPIFKPAELIGQYLKSK